MEVKVNAIMTRAVDYGENDKILTLFSAERGKITAGIKGVKKSGAKLKFAAQYFCFAEYILAEKGGRYTVISASESENFYYLRCDIEKFYAASCVCEAVNTLTLEGDASLPLFTLCVNTLSAMCNGDEGALLVGFLSRALSVCGYGFSADNCGVCGKPLSGKERLRFDFEAGHFTCWECGDGAGVSKATFGCFSACSCDTCGNMPQITEVTKDGKVRALRLLREYFASKIDCRLNSLSEYIRLLQT